MNAGPVVQMRGIARTFRVGEQDVHALRDIDLEIARGEYLSIMGPSGSGKSTLLNVLGLLDRPSAGNYVLDDRDVTTLTEQERAHTRRERIGFVFQFFQLVPRLTATQNIELPLVLSGVAAHDRHERSAERLAALGIADRADHRPDQLSGGQRQRVAIARATITQPAILLADEPTGNLDRASGLEVIDLLESLRDDGITVILVTHDPAIGERADRRIQMEDGAIVADDQVAR